MILTDDKQTEALEARRLAEEQLIDPPPTYASLQSSASPDFVAKTSNYISISRVHNSVKESLIIDPLLFIPLFLRPPVGPGETEEIRNNVRLESVHGNINADITLVNKPSNEVVSPNKNSRVIMHMKTAHGSISAKVHGSPERHAFVLHAESANGEIRLHIPRTFHGPVIVSHRHGFVRFSDSINRKLTTFGEIDGTRRSFLGDFSRWVDSKGAGGWTGDELTVNVRHGNVKIHYDDDAVGSVVQSRPTFLNRIFGF